jgi:hypothetical protein
MADQTIAVVGCVIEAMREMFVDRTPLGGKTVAPQHRGGMNLPIDGLNDEDCKDIPIVSVLRKYTTLNFPEEADLSRGECPLPKVVLIQASVARCSKTFDEQGNPPTAEEMDHEALVLLDDAQRLDWAMCRAQQVADERGLIDNFAVGAWSPEGPDGGILAGMITATFQLTK